MTKRYLKLEIDCGEKTCAAEPGKFCPFMRTRRFGTIAFCLLWHDEDSMGHPVHMEEKDGWLQRRPECLKACEEVEREMFKDAMKGGSNDIALRSQQACGSSNYRPSPDAHIK